MRGAALACAMRDARCITHAPRSATRPSREQVAPAREFDRLNEDFNYFALVGATAFLIVATLGSGWYSSRRDLNAAWK